MDFHKAISMDNSEPDKLLKTFIFSTLYFKDIFVADRMQICLAFRRGKHASTRFTDLQASCVIQCNNILLLFWLTNKMEKMYLK